MSLFINFNLTLSLTSVGLEFTNTPPHVQQHGGPNKLDLDSPFISKYMS